MLQLLNLKTIGITLGILVSVLSAAYIKGCNDGDEKGYLRAEGEWKPKYDRLLNAPPKLDIRTVTVYVDKKPKSGTVGGIPTGEENPENPLAVQQTSMPIEVDGPGTLEVTYTPLAPPLSRFYYDFKPKPMRLDTVYVTVTKTAVEYVERSVFEKPLFYIGVGVAAVGGYAAAGGFSN